MTKDNLKMLSIEIVKWQTNTPSMSPGWLSLSEISYVLDNPSTIPAEYFNQTVMQNYLQSAIELQAFTTTQTGAINYIMTTYENNVRYSLTAFDTSNDLNNNANNRSDQSFWPTFLARRQDMLNLLEVSLEIITVYNVEISNEEFLSLTNAQVQEIINNY